jgi:hypothetical protein
MKPGLCKSRNVGVGLSLGSGSGSGSFLVCPYTTTNVQMFAGTGCTAISSENFRITRERAEPSVPSALSDIWRMAVGRLDTFEGGTGGRERCLFLLQRLNEAIPADESRCFTSLWR